MQFRKITEEQARAALQILKEECGYVDDGRGSDFVHTVMTEGSERSSVCHEYRFQGELGFGGKFRNNGNHLNTPYVDCYSEDKNNKRADMIIKANNRLAELFPQEWRA